MKLDSNDLVNNTQLDFFFCGLKQSCEEQLPCTIGLDTIGNIGPTWAQGDGHKARRPLLPIGELLALILRATGHPPVCGGNKGDPKQGLVTSKEMTLKNTLGVVTKILGEHLNLEIESAITECNIYQMYFYYLSPNTNESQAADYTLNIELVLYLLEFNIVLIHNYVLN